MASTAKPRSDSKIAKLTPELRAEIVRRLSEENQSFKDVAAWLKEDGHAISATALHDWYSIHSWRESAASARGVAEQVRTDAAASGDYDAATLALVKERAYILARTKGANVKDLAVLAGIVGDSAKLAIKQREVGLAERRIVLLEKKAAQADAAQGLADDDTLTDEQRTAKLRQIFRMQ